MYPAPDAPAATTTDPIADPGYKLEGITTCVNHSDFLSHTLPLNIPTFDSITVVTSPEDKATQKVCDFYRVQCVLTDAFRSHWGEFCKGAGINDGLAKLSKAGWVAHIDADIILPPHSRESLMVANLDPTMIYGIDRLEFKNYEDFQRFYANPEPQRQNMFIHTTATGNLAKVATRVAFDHHGGYVPIGFFQLWSPKGSGVYTYPSSHTDAGREDTLFAAQWPRAKRGMIAEILAYHLESEDVPMATNWQKRVTRKFSIDSVSL